MATMKSAVITKPNNVEIRDVEKPTPKDNEVLLKIEAVALCTLEQRAFSGSKPYPYPYVGGHEISAKIAEIGKDLIGSWEIGQPVIVKTLTQCNMCHYCHLGKDTSCLKIGKDKRKIPEYEGIGGLSEYYITTPEHLFPLDEAVDINEASLIEPLSCVIHSIDAAEIDFSESVLIIGAGVMGMLHLECALLKGARVFVSDPNLDRRQNALERGAHAVFSTGEALHKQVNELTDGKGVDVIFFTPPITSLVNELLPLLAKQGRFILYGSFNPDEPSNIKFNGIHYNQQKIVGVVNPGEKDFERATRMLNYKLIDLSYYVSKVYNYQKIEEAFTKSLSKDTYRVVVSFS